MDQRFEPPRDIGQDILLNQILERVSPEYVPNDRGSLEHVAFFIRQSVEPGSEEGHDRRRRGDGGQIGRCGPCVAELLENPVVDEHGQELLDEEWVAFGGLDDLSRDRR